MNQGAIMNDIEQIQAEIKDYLETGEFSIPSYEQMNLLIRRAFVAKDRRFHPEPTPITGFGELK
jgi:hypothetical protein